MADASPTTSIDGIDAAAALADTAEPRPSGADRRPALDRVRVLAAGAGIAIAYVAAAQVGFRLAFQAEQITTVWAPTGIAIAALLLFGRRLWPAIWIGAFAANVGTAAPVWTAALIATGNTLEAVAAVSALRGMGRFDARLQRVGDALAFVFTAALAATTISATVGVTTLCAAAVQPWARLPALWFEWWLGDALGALIVAPAMLTAATHAWSRRDVTRAAAFVGGSLLVTHLVFGQLLGLSPHPLEYVVFPLVIASAVSSGLPITTQVVLGVAGIAIWHTATGSGPFAAGDVHQGLVLLQVFMGVLAATALLLAAAVSERTSSERLARDAAEVLRRRDAMLQLAQRAGGVATFEWDMRHGRARCSAEFFRIFGLPAREGVMASSDWASRVHPDDRERMAEHLARAIQGLEPASADYRIVTPDGRTRWITYAGQLEPTADGDRMLGTVVDITARKALEAELRHHAAEVERILESIGEGFVALDRDFRYVYVNQLAEAMLGRARSELLGRTPWEVFPAETVRESRARLEAALASGAAGHFEVHVPGWNRWYENRVYKSAVGLSIFFSDVTARVQAETALRENRDVLSLAMRGGSMGAWSRNLATNEVWWSRELEEIVGLSTGSGILTEAGFFEIVHEEDRPALRRAVDEAIRTRTDYTVEFRFRHGSGEWRWMEGRGRAVYDPDGTPRTLYGIGIDVTGRKRGEMALLEAKAAAESANQLKDQFLATLSHELRTPLNAILGYARMLQTNAIAPDRRDRAIDAIARNATAQNQLVEDLLDMSRITTGKLRLDPEPVQVADVLREALDGVKPAAEAKRITLDVDLHPAAGTVRADTTRLRQVFWNVLTNAVKFTAEQGRVVTSVRPAHHQVEIVVSDTGVGISPEFLPFVFEPFRQAAAGFDREHGGLGLGLAISRQLVELHGGTIQAASDGPGQGATFTVRLPRLPAETSAPVV